MRKLFMLIGSITILALFMTACGASSIPNTGAGSGNTLNVTMSDYKFDPASYSVPAGASVTVNLKNSGSASHTWLVMSKPISGSFTSADQANVLFSSDQIPAGGSKTVTFTAPTTPGTYQVICSMPGHFENGMVGQLVVK